MSKTVLVAVLDWGLGHATRCIPIIQELQNQSHSVLLAGSGNSLLLLEKEFPDIKSFELTSYDIHYDGSSFALSIIMQSPKIFSRIHKEKKQIDKIIEDNKVDVIISDNRYGCYSKKVKSVFIGHQLNLMLPEKMKWMNGFLNTMHVNRIKLFSEVWIPDFTNSFKYSGALSKTDLIHVRHLGILSRFKYQSNQTNEKFGIAAIVSGPEPQRTIFEDILREELTKLNKKAILIKGKPDSIGRISNGNLTEVDHLNSLELSLIIQSADIVISRSGYSSIMDIAVFGKKVIFVPTPGQTEQEYLAKYFSEINCCVSSHQDDFDLEKRLSELERVQTIPTAVPNCHVKELIASL